MATIFANNVCKIIEAGLGYYSYLKPVLLEHVDIQLPNISETLLESYDIDQEDDFEEKRIIYAGSPRIKLVDCQKYRDIILTK